MSPNLHSLDNSVSILNYDLGKNDFNIFPKQTFAPCLQNCQFSLDCIIPSGKKTNVALTNQRVAVNELPIQDVHGTGQQLLITGIDATTGLSLTYQIKGYANQPYFLFRLMVKNESRSTYQLIDLNLIEVDPGSGGQLCFEEQHHPLDFFKVGWHGWAYSGLRHGNQGDVDSLAILKPIIGMMEFNPTSPIGKQRGEFWGENWGILTDQKSAIVTGLVTMANQFGLLHVNCQPGKASLTLSCQSDGIQFDPGDVFESEWGYLQLAWLPNKDPFVDYVAAVALEMKPRIPKPPPVSWTHWYYYFEHITQEQFLENLEVAAELQAKIPYKVFQLDGGYYQHWGDWLKWNNRFPDGAEQLSRKIKEKGFTPGLWLAPFVVDPRSDIARQYPDWLVRTPSGKPIHSGFFFNFFGNALDLTQPAVLDHLRSLMDRLGHQFGYGFIKADYMYAGALPGVRHNPKLTRAQALRNGILAIREGIGDDAFLLGCGCPFGPAIGIVDAMRIGPDTAPNWTPYHWDFPWIIPLIKKERSIASLRNNIRHTLNMSAIHRRWWWNDPDCLMVRSDHTNLDENEIKSNLSLIGMNGHLLSHSDKLSELNPEQINLISILTPLIAMDAHAIDILEHEMAEIAIVNMERASGKWVNAAFFNWLDHPSGKHINLRQLGFDLRKSLHVFDFWEQSYQRINNDSIRFDPIPGHGCKLLRLCEANDLPCLVGDTLHISQGGEIIQWELSGNSLLIKTMEMNRQVSGRLWLWLPAEPTKIICNQESLVWTQPTLNIYCMQLNFENQASIIIYW
jgi:alpha-galactosidase